MPPPAKMTKVTKMHIQLSCIHLTIYIVKTGANSFSCNTYVVSSKLKLMNPIYIYNNQHLCQNQTTSNFTDGAFHNYGEKLIHLCDDPDNVLTSVMVK